MWRIIFRFYLQSEIKRLRKAVGIKMPDDVRRAQTDLVIKLIAAASNINIHYNMACRRASSMNGKRF